MVKLKFAFLIVMAVLAAVIFFIPLFFPENKSDKGANAKRIRVIVRVRMGCFLGILVLLLLCVIL